MIQSHVPQVGGQTPTIVRIGGLEVSTNEQDVLVTYSLGSCVGVSVYDPAVKVGGLMHGMMPTAGSLSRHTGPAICVDRGVIALLEAVIKEGGDIHRCMIHVAGGGRPVESMERFQIGEKNVEVLRRVLLKNGLSITNQDTGGMAPRTMQLSMSNGQVTVRRDGRSEVL